MPRFRKKPVVIEAVQFDAFEDGYHVGWNEAHGFGDKDKEKIEQTKRKYGWTSGG